jgi:hypothetical protein
MMRRRRMMSRRKMRGREVAARGHGVVLQGPGKQEGQAEALFGGG